MGQHEAALGHFARAIRLGPRDPDTVAFLRGMGAANANLGRHAEAIEWWSRALARVPDDLITLRGMTIAHALAGNVAEAKRLAARVLALDPGMRLARFGEYYTLRRPEDIERAMMGLVTALFHDSGYIREVAEKDIPNGAVFTRNHVTRSAKYLAKYLPTTGLGEWVPIATRIVHFTGYEMPLELIRVGDARDRLVGHLLGTADMLAQMADRCYLEKCRDRLYAEFVLGDVAAHKEVGGVKVLYGSGLDLLRQTPQFVANTIDNRLGANFGHVYRHVEPLYGGVNPYMDAIRQNVEYLRGLARNSRWPMLRRNPPVFTVEKNAMQGVRSLLVQHLKEVWGVPGPVNAG